jgi:hypothetical protein
VAGTDYAADLLGGEKPQRAGPATDYAADLLATRQPASEQASAGGGYYGGAGQAIKDIDEDLPGHIHRAVVGVLTGMGDIPVGIAQLAAKFGPEKVDRAVKQFMKDREQSNQAFRGDYAENADVGRVTGNVVATIPMGGRAVAATLPGRMAQGSKVGAAVGATTPVNPDSEDFALNKGAQVVGGGVAGALGVPVVEGLIKGVGAAVNAVGGFLRGLPNRLTNKASQDAVEQTLTVELQKNGVDFASLSRAARDALILETQKALKTGATVDRDAIARIADFQKIGMEPTRGQVTRDPYQFANERNVGKTEIGKPLAERFGDQNRQLIGAVDETRASTGSAATDTYEAGKNTAAALKAADETERKAVSAAYNAAKEKVGYEAEVPMQPIAQRLGQVIDEVGAENIPSAVAGRLKEFGLMEGKQTKIFTLREAEKLRKLIGNNMPGQRTPTDAALAPLKQSIDDAVNAMAGESAVGEEAAQALVQARAAAGQRFDKIESIPALSDMLKNKQIPAEDFVETYVIRGGVDEVKSLMGQLPPGARRDARAAVIDWLKTKAVSGADDTATFSQSNYNKALDAIGKRNLESIFDGNPQMLEQLRRIGRVAAYVQKAPVGAGVNYSSSATALIDMLDKVGRLPVLSTIVGKPGDIVRATQVTRSLSPTAPVQPAQPLFTMDMLDELKRAGSALAPARCRCCPAWPFAPVARNSRQELRTR